MSLLIEYQTKLNSINTLTIEIENDFSSNFSVIAYDEEGGVFIEKFAETLIEAKKLAKKLYDKIIKQY